MEAVFRKKSADIKLQSDKLAFLHMLEEQETLRLTKATSFLNIHQDPGYQDFFGSIAKDAQSRLLAVIKSQEAVRQKLNDALSRAEIIGKENV